MHYCRDIVFPPSFSTSIISLFSGRVCDGVSQPKKHQLLRNASVSIHKTTHWFEECPVVWPALDTWGSAQRVCVFIHPTLIHTTLEFAETLNLVMEQKDCCCWNCTEGFFLQLLFVAIVLLLSTGEESFRRAVFLLWNQPEGIKQEASLCAAGEINSMEFWVLNKWNSCCTWFLSKMFHWCISLQLQWNTKSVWLVLLASERDLTLHAHKLPIWPSALYYIIEEVQMFLSKSSKSKEFIRGGVMNIEYFLPAQSLSSLL